MQGRGAVQIVFGTFLKVKKLPKLRGGGGEVVSGKSSHSQIHLVAWLRYSMLSGMSDVQNEQNAANILDYSGLLKLLRVLI